MADDFINALGAPSGPPEGQRGGGTDAGSTADILRNQVLSRLAMALENGFPRTVGIFTLAAAATTTVPQTATESTSSISLTALNASAASLMGSAKALYISARTQGASFTVATASGAAAAGTEQFSYELLNLV
jgi:hypothetical protein